MEHQKLRIEVCGGIASGKTTLATLIGQSGIVAGLERFQENPFFDDFYADPSGYAFEAEHVFLLQHFSQVREVPSTSRLVVDFSFALDLAYAWVTLDEADQRCFEVVLGRVLQKIRLPTLIVRLQCSPSSEMDRIRLRNRASEQRLERSYLEEMDAKIDEALASRWFESVPLLRLDSQALDFQSSGAHRDKVLTQVLAAVSAAIGT